jgi:hypothetical protein
VHLLPVPDFSVHHPVGDTVIPTSNTFNIYIYILSVCLCVCVCL